MTDALNELGPNHISESDSAEKQQSLPDWYLLKCCCHVFATDYPFVSCSTCGYINCGTHEQLQQAKENGTLMNLLDSGKKEEWNYTKLLEKHSLKEIKVDFHFGMSGPFISDDWLNPPDDYFSDEDAYPYGNDEWENDDPCGYDEYPEDYFSEEFM